MKKIALDVDGVLLNFMEEFDRVVRQIVGEHIVVKPDELNLTHYDVFKRYGITDEVKDSIFKYMIENRNYASLKPLEGVKEALEAIKAEGFKIYLVTALPEAAREMRLENLKTMLDFIPDEIHCVGMGMSKEEKLKEIRPDIFIDDRIDYLASAPFVYHLAWVDQRERQSDLESTVDVHVHSLKEWVDNHMPRVVKKLNRHYHDNEPLQATLKLENVSRKYSYELEMSLENKKPKP